MGAGINRSEAVSRVAGLDRPSSKLRGLAHRNLPVNKNAVEVEKIIHHQAENLVFDLYRISTNYDYMRKYLGVLNKERSFKQQLIIFHKVLRYAEELENQINITYNNLLAQFNEGYDSKTVVVLDKAHNCSKPEDKIRFSEILRLLFDELLPIIKDYEDMLLPEGARIEFAKKSGDRMLKMPVTEPIEAARNVVGFVW